MSMSASPQVLRFSSHIAEGYSMRKRNIQSLPMRHLGSTMIKRMIMQSAVVAAVFVPTCAFAQMLTATFDTGQQGFTAGPGGPPGPLWYNTNNAQGPSGPGEVGGVITEDTSSDVYVANLNIGPGGTPGILTLADPMSASGYFYLGDTAGQTNDGLFIGFMTPAFGDGNHMGIDIT